MQDANQVEPDANEVEALVAAVTPLFAGKSEHVQAAALADLLAMWLAGHVYLGDARRTRRVHDRLIEEHLKAVRALVPINYAMRVELQLKPSRPN
jgi:hypothetical protein